jgi:hypothetical protein
MSFSFKSNEAPLEYRYDPGLKLLVVLRGNKMVLKMNKDETLTAVKVLSNIYNTLMRKEGFKNA